MVPRLVSLLIFASACRSVGTEGPPSTPATPSTPASEAPPLANAPWTPPNQVGLRAPPFAVDSVMIPGAKVALVSGKVNVVYFWATWNAPAKQSFPKLQGLYLRYRPSDLAMAAVSVDDEVRSVAEAAREWGATFPVGWDEGHTIADRFRPSAMPTLYLVDRHGVIRHVFHGWHDGDQDSIERALAHMLDAKD